MVSTKKASGVLLAVIIGLIIVSFIFSGYVGQGNVSSDVVATVGGTPITVREFSMYSTELKKRWPLGEDQLRDLALRQLIDNKLLLNLSNEIGFTASSEELAQRIKELPYFQTNNQFDINRYKQLLQVNGMTPAQFEESMAADLKTKYLFGLLGSLSFSDKYLKDLENFRSQKLTTHAVRFQKRSLEKFVEVSEKELDEFVKSDANKTKVQSLFEGRRASLDRPEQVKARHILLTAQGKSQEELNKKVEAIKAELTKANFAELAQKYTEEPGGKERKGDLGWFSRGRMVPEFENVVFTLQPGTISSPIKTVFGVHLVLVEDKKPAQPAQLKDHERSLAKELLQKQKSEKLNELVDKLAQELAQSLKRGDKKQLELAQKKYDLVLEFQGTLNKLEGRIGQIDLEQEQVSQIFEDVKSSQYDFKFEDATYVTLVNASSTNPTNETKNKKSDAPKELEGLSTEREKYAYIQKLQGDLIKHLREKSKIVTYRNSN